MAATRKGLARKRGETVDDWNTRAITTTGSFSYGYGQKCGLCGKTTYAPHYLDPHKPSCPLGKAWDKAEAARSRV